MCLNVEIFRFAPAFSIRFRAVRGRSEDLWMISRDMAADRILPYGEWPSPLRIADVVAGAARLGTLLHAGDSLWWTEGRPGDQGRNALCRMVPGEGPAAIVTVLSNPWNVRNRVHEYGGGTLAGDGGRLWFCHDGDAGIHQLDDGRSEPQALLVVPGLRFADLQWCASRGSLLAVCEDHREAGREPRNMLVEIDVDGDRRGEWRVLASGQDFYSNPTPSPDGRWLAWMSWRHPDMPWDASELWCAPWTAEGPGVAVRLAGGCEVSVFQPAWSPGGELHLVSDRSGWWNLWRIGSADLERAMLGGQPARLSARCPLAAEFGQPQWEFGMRSYGFAGDGSVVAIARGEGTARLGRIPAQGGGFHALPLAWSEFRGLQVAGERAWCFAGSADRGETLLELDLASGEARELLPSQATIDPALVSRPRSVHFPGSGGHDTQAFFYAPHHPGIRGPAHQRPPLIVINHGGPTASTSATLRLAVQFWTSRGFAVFDVNYGGSTGFGRAYRRRLDHRWGVVDVEDAVAGVRWLVEQDLVDPLRTAIRGSSAGGFTTLAALAFHRVFRAGVSLYGIGDLSLLAADTHKFESRYLDRLVAPWPEGADIYTARSPLAHVNRMECALLLLQGAEDPVVPPNQAETMYQAVRAKGLPVACLVFPGEQHGFRRAETLERALGAELAFYGRVFGFQPAEPLEPLEIANLPDAGEAGLT